jgi:RHS repeat-associated protein
MLANWLGDRCPNIKLADILSFNGPTETIYTPRFSTYDLNGMGGDLQTVLNHLTDEAAATGAVANVMATQYQATCEAYATQWIATLKECDAIATVLSAADEADLKRRLIGICVLGSDENHLMGSSSVKPGSVYIDPASPASSYSNFPQVIKEYLQSKSIPVSATCHPYLIEAPKPYEKAIPATVQQVISKPDQCQCTQINKVYREYQRLNYAGTFSNYLENAYQTYMSQADLEKLLSLCNDTYPCAFLTEPIGLPPVLQCFSNGNGTSAATTACIECTEYFTIKQQFTTETGLTGPVANPQTTAEEQANMAFQQYANYHTGFSKLWTEYLAFENVCNNNVIPCGTLSSLLQQYYTTYGTAFTDESQCRAQFTTFFNNQLQTSFSFDELMSLFRNCGDVPEVCRPVVTCESFKTLLDGFYDMYGMPDAMSGNCEQNFTNYFNLKFNRNYTYTQIQALYNQACGCTLDVCTQLNCFLLTRAYTKFRNSYNQIVLPGTNCQDAFTSFFNDYFSTTGMTYPAIYDLYEACYANQCGPNPATICQPVQTCAHIQLLITDFNNTHPPGTLESSDCLSLFTAYYNQQMGTTYSYADIAALITQLCGSVNICQPRESCETYAVVLANYAYNASSGLTCEDHFTSYFNQYFQTSYTYSAIVSLYQQCGFNLQVCNNNGGGGGGVAITDCAQLQAVVQNFLSIYPAPANQFGSHCMEKFALYFNTVFHQAYSENDIRDLYQQLCGQPLNICDVNDCNNYRVFTDRFNQVYYTIPVPNNLKQELYTRQFNQQFFEPGLYTYSELKSIVGFCTVTDEPDPPGQGPVRRNLNQLQLSEYDPAVLRGFKAVYLQMHPQESAETCPDLFTSNFNYYLVREYTYDSLMHLYDAVCGPGSGYICAPLLAGRNQGTVTVLSGSELPAGYAFSPKLCGGSEPVFPPGPPVTTDPCKDLEKIAVAAGEDRYTRYIDSLKNVFELAYRQKCLAAKDLESLTVTGAVSEYHYTLYYYDQSGSLVRTVPPAGVDARHGDATFLNGVAAKRADARLNGPSATNYLVPAHRLVTAYCYNSLNQVTAQQTPDAGLSRFWYDRLGRLAVSQNAQQYIDNRFSYTRYDLLGRITEVGQQRQPSGSMSQAVSQSEASLTSWLNGGTGHEQITRTVYDAPYEAPYDFLCPQYLCQQNLRNRVSYTQVFLIDPGQQTGMHQNATYYSYDVHGNVDVLLQDHNTGIMKTSGNRFKKLLYDYDLVSGKVNKVSYQPGLSDAFYHRYVYDAENRVTEVYTSRDNLVWDKDAQYGYYKHGPLARMVLGNQVQGVDYAYTLQGWLKGVNSTTAGMVYDMGLDGNLTSANRFTARDVYGFSLNYYTGDYRQIRGDATPVFAVTASGLGAAADGVNTGLNLYNGNIRAMAVNIPALGAARLHGYRYDQLNRLVSMNVYKGFTAASNSFTPQVTQDYRERVSYDANGNILTYERNGPAGSGLAMDALTYQYAKDADGNLTGNRLRYVHDNISSNYTEDIDSQTPLSLPAVQAERSGEQATDNYRYDAIGNLVQDAQAGIQSITWNVYGKISNISKNNSTNINYLYDASGNRVNKKSQGKETVYVRDASGNVMSVYVAGDGQFNSGRLTQTEAHIYGSSRLGMVQLTTDMQPPLVIGGLDVGEGNPVATGPVPATGLSRGSKVYELTNHLGNVLATIADRKVGKDTDNDGQVDYYEAVVVSASDYYPFGMQLPGQQLQQTENGGDAFPGGLSTPGSNALNGYNSGTGLISQAEDNFTVELWVNPTSPHEIDPETQSNAYGISGQQFIIDPVWGSADGTVAGMGISVGTNGVSVYEHANGYMPALLVWEGPVTGWTHVAVVYENKQPRLYINGVLVRTGLTSDRQHVRPGNLLGSGAYGVMPGTFDEVRVWNVVRSEAEIRSNMRRSVAAPQSGLVAYWPIGSDGDGSGIPDMSGNGYNVQLPPGYNSGSYTTGAIPLSPSGNSYRYGFNGKEKSDEIYGEGSAYDFGERIYNPRIGRWLSLDPLQKKYPAQSPYNYVENNPLVYKDIDGRDKWITIYVDNQKTGQKMTLVKLVSKSNSDLIRKVHRDSKSPGKYAGQDWFDVSTNVYITLDKEGKISYSVAFNQASRFRTNTPTAAKWYAVTKLTVEGLKTKDSDINFGFHMTSSDGKGFGDPFGPGAKKVENMKEASDLISSVGGFPSNGSAMEQIQDLVETIKSGAAVEKVMGALEALKSIKETSDATETIVKPLVPEKKKKKEAVEVYRNGVTSETKTDDPSVIHEGHNGKPDTLFYFSTKKTGN